MNMIEELISRKWILKYEDPVLYYEVKDNMKELNIKMQDKFGFALIVNPYLVKLEKIPGKAEAWMGIQEFVDIKDYRMFCFLLMFLEDKEVEEKFVLSNLTEYIQVQFKDEEISWTNFRSRKQVIRVIQYALKQNLLVQMDGNDDTFLKDESGEVLYENTGYSRYFLRNFSRDIMEYTRPQDFWKSEWLDMEEDRGIVRKQRIYRRLLLSCGVYKANDGDKDDDFSYIRNYRKAIEQDFQRMFACQIQVHHSSAFMVLEEECKMGKVFPQNNVMHDLLLMVHHDIRKKVKNAGLKTDENETITMGLQTYINLITKILHKQNKQLPKKYQSENKKPQDLAYDVFALARSLGFVEQQADNVYIYPIAGKIIGEYMEVIG